MGLVLDSSVLIASERSAKRVSDLLATFAAEYGETDVVLSSITVIELEHGLHRAPTPELVRKRRDYLDTVFAAIPIEPFSKEMAQIAAKVDAQAKQTGQVIPFCRPADRRHGSLLRLRGGDQQPAPLPNDPRSDDIFALKQPSG